MTDLVHLERKLHCCQVVLWLKQAFEEVRAGGDECFLNKTSVYGAYVDMCRWEARPSLLTRPVVGKMVRRAFPHVGNTRRGPRGNVQQFYVGLRSRPLLREGQKVVQHPSTFPPNLEVWPHGNASDYTATTWGYQLNNEESADDVHRSAGLSGSSECLATLPPGGEYSPPPDLCYFCLEEAEWSPSASAPPLSQQSPISSISAAPPYQPYRLCGGPACFAAGSSTTHQTHNQESVHELEEPQQVVESLWSMDSKQLQQLEQEWEWEYGPGI